ncbi:MAG: ERF family protein [Nannocystaceae bacterium]
MSSADTDKLYPALAEAQARYPKIEKKKSGHYGNYADLPSIMESVRGPNTEAGLIVIHTSGIEGGVSYSKTSVIHVESGQSMSAVMRLDSELSDQSLGKSLTYFRRYCLMGLLGICADEDLDGQPSDDEQRKRRDAAKQPDPPPDPLDQSCKVGSFWASARNLLKAAGIEDKPSQDECVRGVMLEVGKEIMQDDKGFESTKEMTERDASEVLRRLKLDLGATSGPDIANGGDGSSVNT